MPERFRPRPRQDDDSAVLGQAERNGVKLDRIKDDVGDMRVAMTSLAGDVKAMVTRLAEHDQVQADFERRMRSLERWRYSVPSLAVLLSVLSLAIGVWFHFIR